jgi:hypothetical protein
VAMLSAPAAPIAPPVANILRLVTFSMPYSPLESC